MKNFPSFHQRPCGWLVHICSLTACFSINHLIFEEYTLCILCLSLIQTPICGSSRTIFLIPPIFKTGLLHHSINSQCQFWTRPLVSRLCASFKTCSSLNELQWSCCYFFICSLFAESGTCCSFPQPFSSRNFAADQLQRRSLCSGAASPSLVPANILGQQSCCRPSQLFCRSKIFECNRQKWGSPLTLAPK